LKELAIEIRRKLEQTFAAHENGIDTKGIKNPANSYI
jgi:hypothetical protein